MAWRGSVIRVIVARTRIEPFPASEEAHEDAKSRLLVWRIARQIRLDRGVPDGEVVRVTLHDKDGTVLFEGDVR